MEAEVVSASRQIELLKEGYSKARDNLRAEQSVRELGLGVETGQVELLKEG